MNGDTSQFNIPPNSPLIGMSWDDLEKKIKTDFPSVRINWIL